MTNKYTLTEDPLFQQLVVERNLKHESIRHYKKALTLYCKYHGMTLQELYDEADNEEEQGIRAKNRQIVQRLRSYRTYLIQEDYASNSITNYYAAVKAFYRHFLIELPYIPSVKLKQKQIMYEEIPHKENIIDALSRTSNLKHRAIVYFMCSSGTARNEVSNLTIQDFIDATKDYHHQHKIYDVVQELEGQDNIIPLFQLTRAKTSYRYYTCCTPETTQHIIKYLKSRPLKKLRPQQTLFDIGTHSITVFFQRLNRSCGFPEKFLHPHALRKYHATLIGDYDFANLLQGRKQSPVRESYFKADPSRIKKEYMKHIPDLTFEKSRIVTIESDEVKELKKQNKNLEEQILEDKERLNDLQNKIERISQENKEIYKLFREEMLERQS